MTDEEQADHGATGPVAPGKQVPWPPTPSRPRATIISAGGSETITEEPAGRAATKETWRDWMPEGAAEPERLLSRDELVARLGYYHIEADATDLRFWEQRGILPRPVRQRRDGAMRTTYPEWALLLVQRIRQLQAEGFSLAQIRPRIRRFAELMLLQKAEEGERAVGVVTRSRGPFWKDATGPEDVDLPIDLGTNLIEAAQRVAVMTGVPSRHVNVVIVSEDGGETRFTLLVPHD